MSETEQNNALMSNDGTLKVTDDLALSQDNQLIIKPRLQEEVEEIKQVVDETKQQVSTTNIDLTDEDALDLTIQHLADAQHKKRDVTAIRRELSRSWDTRKSDSLQQFDDFLNKYGFYDLARLDAQAKELKKDKRALKIKKNWDTVEAAFNANLSAYPIIGQIAPRLTDFSLFKLRHPKFVSGAKAWHFGDKQMAALNQDLADISECLTDLVNNQMNLNDNYRYSILQEFIANTSKENYYELKNRALNQMREDALREQAAKQAAQNQATPSQNTAPTANNNQVNQMPNQGQVKQVAPTEIHPTRVLTSEANKFLSDYTNSHLLTYPHISNNDKQKNDLIYDLVHQLDQPTSPYYQFIAKYPKDEQERLKLTVIKQITLI